jgi:signal transduction histidine kinase
LEKAIAKESLSQKLLTQLLDDLTASMEDIDTRKVAIQPINEVVERVRENWSSIAVISFHADPAVLDVIERDSLCKTSIIDVIPELVFNGVKHGKATEIDLLLELIGNEKVRLSAIDNGNFEKLESTLGLGTTILNESCISWTRERDNARTVTITDFALSPL